ncbi:MAG: serine kinase [Rhodobacteraceae bacterium]|nr:serine kinase [Paracoccaceae bacterium]
MTTQHGTAVSRNGRAVLILGRPGAGKSRLAFQLLAYGAELVADDAVELTPNHKGIMLSCPSEIKGMIEARGVGLLTVDAIEKAALAFVVDLDKTADARLPQPKDVLLHGMKFPLVFGKGNPDLGAIVWCLLGEGQILPVD